MKIAYAILMMFLFGTIQLLTWEWKEIQFLINVILFGVVSFNLYRYYEKSEKQKLKL